MANPDFYEIFTTVTYLNNEEICIFELEMINISIKAEINGTDRRERYNLRKHFIR